MRETLATSAVLLRYGWRSLLGGLLSKHESLTMRLLMLFTFSYLPLLYFYQNYRTLQRLADNESLGRMIVDWKVPPAAFVASSPIWTGLPQLVWLGICVMLLSIFAGSILAVHLMAHPQRTDKDMEWMQTFPVRTRSILWGRLLQSSLIQPYFFLLVLPFLLCFSIIRGQNLGFSIVTAALLGWMAMLVASSLGIIINSFVSFRLTPGRQRDFRFLATFLLIAAFFLIYFPFIMNEGVYWRAIFRMAPVLQDSPVIHLMERLLRGETSSILPLFALFAGVLALAQGCVVISEGIVTQAASSPQESKKQESRVLAKLLDSFTPVVRREIRILMRDRSQWATLMSGPMIALGYTIWNSFGDQSLAQGRSLLLMSVMMYLMMTGLSLQVIFQRERPSLWFYAAMPMRLSAVLREQRKVPAVLFGLVYALTFVAVAPQIFWQDADSVLRLALGLAFIFVAEKHFRSVALLSYTPAPENTVGKPLHLMIWLSLTPALSFLVIEADAWNVAAFLIPFTALAHGYEKKVLALEEYLIDPSYRVPRRADLSQGFLAAMIYTFALITANGLASFLHFNLSVEFLAAAAMLLALHYYGSSREVDDLPAYFGAVRVLDLLFLMLAGNFILQAAGMWDKMTSASTFLERLYDLRIHPAAPATAVLLFISLARSVTEEYIFRGLIQRGLSSRLGWPWAVIISAGLTSLCHKPQDFGPILLTSLGSGLLYHRTKVLWPGIILALAVQSLRILGY